MSSKNIYTLTKQTYIEKNEQRLLKLSDAYFYKNHFLLGEGANRDEMIFSTIFDAFLCERNCELNDLINKKINGELEPKRKKKNPIIIAKSEDDDGDITINNYNAGFWDKEVEW